jgi:ABC-type branched-subunit amino acid transport system ATPase component/branched-subunit amino acid ABC-type transport system permease component
MLDVIRFAILGAAAGSILAMLALGINVVYRASRVVNFSHAATAVAAAYIYRDVAGTAPVPVAILVALLAGMAIGALTDLAIMRPMRNASALTRAIATIGILLLIQSVLNIRYGTAPVVVAGWLPTTPVPIGPVTVGLDRIIIFGISVVTTAVLYLVYRRSSFGIASTALSASERSLAALGKWRPHRVSLANWMVAGGLAAFAGVLIAPITVLTPSLALSLVVPILSAALLGNLSAFWLTFGSAVAIGVAQSEIGRLELFQGAADVIPFLVIVIVLAIRGTSLPQRGDTTDRLPVIGSGRVPWRPILVVSVLVLVLVLFVLPDEWVAAVTAGVVSAVVLLSLVVVTGYAGQLSLASFALAGIAALVSAQLVASVGWAFLPAAIVGVLATAPVGFIIGLPAVRTRGTSLAIVTLGLAVALQTAVFDNAAISGGFSGLDLGTPTLFGLDISPLLHPRRYAVLAIVTLALASIVVLNVRRSAIGRRMVAVRGNERAAASLGVSVTRTKLTAFMISAMLAGTGGVLIVFMNQYVSFGNPGGRFDPSFSLNAIAQSTVGGIGYASGAIIGTITEPGAVVSKLLLFITSGSWFTLIGAVLLLLTVVTAPSGVAANLQIQIHQLATRTAKPRSRRAITATEPVPPAPALMGETRLEVRDLTVTFGGNRALNAVNLDIVGGRVLGIIGPNGAGKTTLVDAITGYNTPSAGIVSLAGRDLTSLAPTARARAGVGRSFQSLELFEDLSVRDNLLVGSEPNRWYDALLAGIRPGRPTLSDAARVAVDRFALTAGLDGAPGTLSYGERRLLAIARALAGGPRVILLDEPAAGLGSEERIALRELVRSLADEWNLAVLIIEHDVELVLGVSDTVVALDFGTVIASGTPDEVRNDPAVIAAYFGTAKPVFEPTASDDLEVTAR